MHCIIFKSEKIILSNKECLTNHKSRITIRKIILSTGARVTTKQSKQFPPNSTYASSFWLPTQATSTNCYICRRYMQSTQSYIRYIGRWSFQCCYRRDTTYVIVFINYQENSEMVFFTTQTQFEYSLNHHKQKRQLIQKYMQIQHIQVHVLLSIFFEL